MNNKRYAVLELSDLQKALGIKGVFGNWIARLAYRILELEEVNRIHDKFHESKGAAFSANVLKEVGVTCDIPSHQLERIPSEGGFLTISNHHFGGLDGLILSSVIGSRRSEYKILTTFLLSMIPNLKESFLGVDNFSSGGTRSVSGIRAALEHISQGNPLGLFPAGEVATWQPRKRRTSIGRGRVVEDIPWAENIIKMIKKSALPVIPVYFDGENSKWFHILGKIHPRLRTIRLIHELFNKRGTVVKVRIGQPIQPSEIEGMQVPDLGKYLRNRCYALKAQCIDGPQKIEHSWSVPVAPAVASAQVIAEMDNLSDAILFETGDYSAYLLSADQAPAVMKELYRLREETFRAIGEGTGLEQDTDIYDSYYKHMIVWHKKNRDIIGAYRLGFGPEIFSDHGGVRGFYSSTLFKYGPKAAQLLPVSMELGRSFIAAKYQKEVFSLKLLLAGLATATLKCPQLEYFSGPVSISNDIPLFYKSLIYRYITQTYSIEEAKKVALATHPFEPDYMLVNPDQLMQFPEKNIDMLDKLLSNLSDGLVRLPVLVRKYFSCGAKLPCFNVDPDFSFSLDGLIFLKHSDFPQKTTRSILRGIPEEIQNQIWRHFYGTPLYQ
ncbi:MAG: lysophospholipid acyltransferase family protein [Bacteroidales bacterium]|nr:lysophospholipid acyltransferase family protein [Bacteroidales bacterium]